MQTNKHTITLSNLTLVRRDRSLLLVKATRRSAEYEAEEGGGEIRVKAEAATPGTSHELDARSTHAGLATLQTDSNLPVPSRWLTRK